MVFFGKEDAKGGCYLRGRKLVSMIVIIKMVLCDRLLYIFSLKNFLLHCCGFPQY